MPSTLTTIGDYGILSVPYKNVNIPINVISIGDYAFYGNTNSQTITLKGRTNTQGMNLGNNWKGNAELLFDI